MASPRMRVWRHGRVPMLASSGGRRQGGAAGRLTGRRRLRGTGGNGRDEGGRGCVLPLELGQLFGKLSEHGRSRGTRRGLAGNDHGEVGDTGEQRKRTKQTWSQTGHSAPVGVRRRASTRRFLEGEMALGERR